MLNSSNFGKNEVIILGVRIDDLTKEEVLISVKKYLAMGKINLIFTPNPEICLWAEKDEKYRHVLNGSDLNIPDGIGLKLGAEILGQKLLNRITGVDLTWEILKVAEQKKCSVYLLGGKKGVAEKAAKKIIEKFPGLRIVGAAMGFSDKGLNYRNKKIAYSQKENQLVIDAINFKKPDILIVAYGAPKQELWLTENRNRLSSVKLAVGVGGTLDYVSGKIKRAPKWWRDLGMEWFFRLLKQPSRYRRIADATIKFPLACYKWQTRIKYEFRPNVLAVITQGNKFLIQKNKRFTNDHWQFPQGGVDKREKPERAVIREVSEELGAPAKLFKLIKKFPFEHAYEGPKFHQLIKGYKGQSQQFFLLEYLGKDEDFDLSQSVEVADIKWVEKGDLIKYIHPKRHESLKKILLYL